MANQPRMLANVALSSVTQELDRARAKFPVQGIWVTRRQAETLELLKVTDRPTANRWRSELKVATAFSFNYGKAGVCLPLPPSLQLTT